MDLNNFADVANLKSTDIDCLKLEDLRHILKLVIPTVKENVSQESQLIQILQRLQDESTRNFEKIYARLDILADNIKSEIRQEFEPILKKLQDEQENLRLVVTKQQTFIEQIDSAHRENKIIITGVPEDEILVDGNRSANNDTEKCELLFAMIDSQPQVQDIRRLGKPNSTKNRPLKVTLCKNSDRQDVVSKATALSTKDSPFKQIKIKKDTHPAVRHEWARLHESMRKEKAKTTNVGCDIRLDYINRQLLRDGSVIDTFVNPFI